MLLFVLTAALAPTQAQDEVVPEAVADTAATDGLSAPLYAPFVRPATPWAGMYGYMPTLSAVGPDSWLLHEGFNAQLSLSLTTGLGHQAPSGVGFGQDAAFMYALPLTKRFSVAGGVYMSHLDWGGYTYRQVGFAAVAAYQLSEKISLYAYGSKSLLSQDVPALWSPYIDGDRLGGMLHVKFNDTFSMGFSVERRSQPGRSSDFYGHP